MKLSGKGIQGITGAEMTHDLLQNHFEFSFFPVPPHLRCQFRKQGVAEIGKLDALTGRADGNRLLDPVENPGDPLLFRRMQDILPAQRLLIPDKRHQRTVIKKQIFLFQEILLGEPERVRRIRRRQKNISFPEAEPPAAAMQDAAAFGNPLNRPVGVFDRDFRAGPEDGLPAAEKMQQAADGPGKTPAFQPDLLGIMRPFRPDMAEGIVFSSIFWHFYPIFCQYTPNGIYCVFQWNQV